MNNNYYDNYTVIKNRDEQESLNDQYETDYVIFNDIFPYHYIGRKIKNKGRINISSLIKKY